MKFAVEIDQITLHGFPSVDRIRLSRAFRAELSRLISREGLSAKAADMRHIPASDIRASAGDGRAIGHALARSVHGALKR